MSIATILLPLFVEVALTFGLMFWMGFSRLSVIKAGKVKVGDIALGQNNWPQQVQLLNNSYASQFQAPVLFYVLVLLAIITRHADFLFVILSWVFVLSRFVHVYIHNTSNYVRYRFYAFLIGSLVLMVMWIMFAVEILLGLA